MLHQQHTNNIICKNILQWYAVYTKSRCEKVIDLRLKVMGIDSFLPLYRCRRRWKDRTKTVDLPLFSSYLFVKTIPKSEQYYDVLDIPEVAAIVGNSECPIPVPDSEIQAIKCIVSSGVILEPLTKIITGCPVRIIRGPLCGLEGVVESCGTNNRIVINVKAIGQSVSLDIDILDVELL